MKERHYHIYYTTQAESKLPYLSLKKKEGYSPIFYFLGAKDSVSPLEAGFGFPDHIENYQLVEGILMFSWLRDFSSCLAEYKRDPTLQIHLQIISFLHE